MSQQMPAVIMTSDSQSLFLRTAGEAEPAGDDVVVRAALHEPAAFGLLYERYYERVYRYCRARTRTHEDSADLAQQVFVHAFSKKRRSFPRRRIPQFWTKPLQLART